MLSRKFPLLPPGFFFSFTCERPQRWPQRWVTGSVEWLPHPVPTPSPWPYPLQPLGGGLPGETGRLILSAGHYSGAVTLHGKVEFWKTDHFEQSWTTDTAWVSLNPWLPSPDTRLLTPKWERDLPSLRKAKGMSLCYFHWGRRLGKIEPRQKDPKNVLLDTMDELI